jgi:hypothetical protein
VRRREVRTESGLILLENRLYVGIDESNHGMYPEVFVAAMSGNKGYTSKGVFSKRRTSDFPPLSSSAEVYYSFLLASRTDYRRFPKHEFLARVIKSLIRGEVPRGLGGLEIYVDGSLFSYEIIPIISIISRACKISKGRIRVFSGRSYDQTYSLVNLADAIAHNLFRHNNLESLSKNNHQRFL